MNPPRLLWEIWTKTTIMDGQPLKPEYKLFHTSAANIDGMIAMIKKAEESIDIETFYFLPDAIGRKILDILIEKANEGVAVRLLVDSMGSFSLSQSLYMDAFRKAGVHVRFFNSFIPFSKSNKTFWYFRNHRRTIIVDNFELFVGSICIGEPTTDWLETGIIVKNSQSIEQAAKAFNHTWHKSLHPSFRVGTSSKLSTDAFSYITQAPMHGERYVYNILVDRIRAAKKSVTLVAPYIVPDRRLVRALRNARRRKVEITIITSKETDSRLADLARNTYITRMLMAGFSVYFNDKMIHSKIAVFDDETACISSLNLDNISLRYNYECAMIIDDLDCVKEINHAINRDMLTDATKLHLSTWRQRNLWTRFLENLVWPIRKFL